MVIFDWDGGMYEDFLGCRLTFRLRGAAASVFADFY